MTVELFTLCEGAFNTNGKLTIVNTFEDIIALEYPWRGPLGMALKLLIDTEKPGDYVLTVCIKSKEGDKMLHKMDAHLRVHSRTVNDRVHISMATNIQGMIISLPGDYAVEVLIDGKLLKAFPFKALIKND